MKRKLPVHLQHILATLGKDLTTNPTSNLTGEQGTDPERRPDGDPLVPSLTFSSTFALGGDYVPGIDFYGRSGNPTWRTVEAVLSRLEGGQALVFPSGMAAASACLFPFLKAGDVLLLPSDGYYTVRDLADSFLAALGVEVRYYETARGADQNLAGVQLIWLETPSNPGMDVCDMAQICANAKNTGTLVVVDNTTMTPLGQSPLSLGADLVMSSDTKAMNGHSDILIGHVASTSPERMEKVHYWRTKSGSICSPMDAWLLYRGLQTLELRFSRACDNALALAAAANGHRAVKEVRYPGLETDPSHAIAAQQMRYGGPIFSLFFAGRAEADRFLSALKIAANATSFGGVHSLAERRARWDATNPPGLVRFAAGCEPTEALIQDFVGALEQV